MNIMCAKNRATLDSERNGGELTDKIIKKYVKLMLNINKKVDKIEFYFKNEDSDGEEEEPKEEPSFNRF